MNTMKKNMEVEGATKTCRKILAEAEAMVQEYGWYPWKAYGQAYETLDAIWDAYMNMNLFIGCRIVTYYKQSAFNKMMKH